MRNRGALIALTGALLLAGCKSQWYQQHEVHNLITTEVTLRSEPSGANITWQNQSIGRTPARMPVEYDHTEQLWSRQVNQGELMREDMGPVVKILTFPVWGIASFFHTTQDRRRHVYSGNMFDVVVTKPGYQSASRQVELQGEDEVDVSFRLEKR
jgi:hypothetical protein